MGVRTSRRKKAAKPQSLKGRFEIWFSGLARAQTLKRRFEIWFSGLATAQTIVLYLALIVSAVLLITHNPTGGYERGYHSMSVKSASDFEGYEYAYSEYNWIDWSKSDAEVAKSIYNRNERVKKRYSSRYDYSPTPMPNSEKAWAALGAEARDRWIKMNDDYQEYLEQIQKRGWILIGDGQDTAIMPWNHFFNPHGWRSRNGMRPPIIKEIAELSVFLKLLALTWVVTWVTMWLIGIRQKRPVVID